MNEHDAAGWRDGTIALPWVEGLPDGPQDRWLALPPNGPARLLAPRGHLKAVLPAITNLIGHSSPLKRTAINAAARSLTFGGAALIPDRPTWSLVASRLLQVARDVAGQPDAIAVIRLNPNRPNPKPVLQLLSPVDDSTTAYVKVGWDALAARLIQAEATTLAAIRPPDGLVVPRLLGVREGDRPVIAVSPFTEARGDTPQTEHDLARAALRLFTTSDDGVNAPLLALRDAPLVQDVTARLEALRTAPVARAVLERVAAITARYGEVEVATGRWHGDWAPGNAILGTPTVAWDWERSSDGAPLGLDAAYVLSATNPPAQAVRDLDAMLASHPNEGHAALLVSLALLVRATRHAEAAAAGLDTRARETLASLDESLAS